MGSSTATSDKEFYRKYFELLEVANTTVIFIGFCYTQFADTFREANGLLCADRTPKIPLERIARATHIPRTYIPGGV